MTTYRTGSIVVIHHPARNACVLAKVIDAPRRPGGAHLVRTWDHRRSRGGQKWGAIIRVYAHAFVGRIASRDEGRLDQIAHELATLVGIRDAIVAKADAKMDEAAKALVDPPANGVAKRAPSQTISARSNVGREYLQ